MALDLRKVDGESQLFIVPDEGIVGFVAPMTDREPPTVDEIQHLNALARGFDPDRDPITDIIQVDPEDPTHHKILMGLGGVAFISENHLLKRVITEFWEVPLNKES